MTFVAGLRVDGLTAPFVIDYAMNGAIFVEYLRQCLVLTLETGDIVIIDNLPAHKRQQVREMIEAAGAELQYILRRATHEQHRRNREAEGLRLEEMKRQRAAENRSPSHTGN